MWEQKRIRQRPQRMIDRQRLNLEHVQPGARDAVLAQSINQRGLVDDVASGSIDQVRGELHCGEFGATDQTTGFWGGPDMNRHNV
jgi:hypothetical protein